MEYYFKYFHFSKFQKKIIIIISLITHLVSVINRENWPKAIIKRDRISKNLPRFDINVVESDKRKRFHSSRFRMLQVAPVRYRRKRRNEREGIGLVVKL